MKEFEKPVLEIESLKVEDIITTSQEDFDPGTGGMGGGMGM